MSKRQINKQTHTHADGDVQVGNAAVTFARIGWFAYAQEYSIHIVFREWLTKAHTWCGDNTRRKLQEVIGFNEAKCLAVQVHAWRVVTRLRELIGGFRTSLHARKSGNED